MKRKQNGKYTNLTIFKLVYNLSIIFKCETQETNDIFLKQVIRTRCYGHGDR